MLQFPSMSIRDRFGWIAMVTSLGYLNLSAAVQRVYLAYTVDYPAVYEAGGADFVTRLEVFRPFDGKAKSHRFRRHDGEYTLQWSVGANQITLSRSGLSLVIDMAEVLARIERYLAAHAEASPRRLP